MIESIKASTTTPPAAASDATSKDSQRGSGAPQPAPVASQTSSDSQDVVAAPSKPATRLLIDQDKVTGVFVYRIVDSNTGNLLAEIPNDQIANLKDADDYVSGSVISTNA